MVDLDVHINEVTTFVSKNQAIWSIDIIGNAEKEV